MRERVNETRVNERMNKKKKQVVPTGIKNYFFLLAPNYSAHLSIDVHYSNSAKKFSYCSTATWGFFFFFFFGCFDTSKKAI